MGLLTSERVSIGEKGGSPISLDASVRETHSVTGQVSDHPVETGVDIVDHYRVQPRQVEIQFVVTNTPLIEVVPGASLINSLIGLVQGDKDPSDNAWAEFQRFIDEAAVLTIITSLKTYTSMVLTDLSVTRDVGTTQSLHGTLSVREIKFVETEIGAAIVINPLGQAVKAVGKKTNKASNTEQAKLTSGGVKIGQGIGFLN